VNLKKRQWKYYNEFEEHKEKRLKKSKQSLRDLWDTIKQSSSVCIVRVPEGEVRGAIFEKIIPENFHIWQKT